MSLKFKKSLYPTYVNIIPYHSAPSLVLIKYIDLSFLLFVAANKYVKKLFDLTFVITPKFMLWFVVIFMFWLYFLFFFYYFYSIHIGNAFWLTNKFHFLTCVVWCALCSVCDPTVDSSIVERMYSSLEVVYQKHRNRLSVENLRELFFLAILKLPVKDFLNSADEAKYS